MILITFLIGLYLGIFLGSFLVKRMYKDLINDYKKDINYWFESYMEILKWYQEMKEMHFKEAVKNVIK